MLVKIDDYEGARRVGDSIRSFLYTSVANPKTMDTEELGRALTYLLLTGTICMNTYNRLVHVVDSGLQMIVGRDENGSMLTRTGKDFNPIEEGRRVVRDLCTDPNIANCGITGIEELLEFLNLYEYPMWFLQNETTFKSLSGNALLWDQYLIYTGSSDFKTNGKKLCICHVSRIYDGWSPQFGTVVQDKLVPGMHIVMHPKDDNPHITMHKVDGGGFIKLDLSNGNLYLIENNRPTYVIDDIELDLHELQISQ